MIKFESLKSELEKLPDFSELEKDIKKKKGKLAELSEIINKSV